MRRARPPERGSVTVEFAVALPLLAVVLALAVTAIAGSAMLVRLTGGAGALARALGRDDTASAAAVRGSMLRGASTTVVRNSGVVCVTAVQRVALGPSSIPIRARGCAADGGR